MRRDATAWSGLLFRGRMGSSRKVPLGRIAGKLYWKGAEETVELADRTFCLVTC